VRVTFNRNEVVHEADIRGTARRFKRQVFVSLDLGSLGLHADSVLPVLEREVVVWLAGVLTPAS
jgi:hypothetical protein